MCVSSARRAISLELRHYALHRVDVKVTDGRRRRGPEFRGTVVGPTDQETEVCL
ncbi:unnamed protein product, partial [Ixodes pacificus]